MKKIFRIHRYGFQNNTCNVEMKVWFFWIVVKRFRDINDCGWAYRQALELLEKLNEEEL